MTPGQDGSAEIDLLAGPLRERYRFEGLLGRGGMATVCRATDLRHGRPVAIRIRDPELSEVVGADRSGYDAEEDAALVTLIRKGWGRDTLIFRQIFTSQFFHADADPESIDHFNEIQRLSADPETAARYHASCHRRADGRDIYRQVSTPSLVVHFQDDGVVNAEEGRLLASTIPGAQLVLLPGGTHYFPTDPEVASKVAGAITEFLQAGGQA